MVSYLNSRLNQRVGGGECWHLATEALRVANAEFIPQELGADAPAAGDLVWGSLVTTITPGGSAAESVGNRSCQPGDLIQFGSAEFGETVLPLHFTAVVAEVNEQGQPKSMFLQNWKGERTVKKVAMDPTALTAGWMRIYRPIARIDRPAEWKFTVVNNDASSQTYDLQVGVESHGLFSPAAVNTSGCYRVHWIVTDGTVPNVVSSDGVSYFLETAEGYEIVRISGEVRVRHLNQ